ncbi:MAG: glutamate synthase, partial [Candidatus Omnitrophica bacterium]|nr:glutamate synthase [Candidatus Omnitrophota bacterium]
MIKTKTKEFLKKSRQTAGYRPVPERLKDFKETALLPTKAQTQEQASRCMDCGTPFCHWACPLSNYVPELNGLISRGQWKRALDLLQSGNNFPEITGRLCPALCEYSCVLGINDEPVTCRENELAIIEYGFKKGWIKPDP